MALLFRVFLMKVQLGTFKKIIYPENEKCKVLIKPLLGGLSDFVTETRVIDGRYREKNNIFLM